ncbi:class C sortase [Enterococcus sp. HY326]|uniref:class C sortase n=1 Tax=Enterococcus sp. HY326 TaxID=2971265 RepID=UPI0022401020|nr:class C sortase [Enterococcus sp. HY326]
MKKTTRKFIQQFTILFLFFVGALVMLYPFYSDALSNMLDQVRISQYQKAITKEEIAQRLARLKEAAKKQQETSDPFSRLSNELEGTVYEDHLLGTLNIPALSVEMPIFDQTAETLLEMGATVVGGTDMPVGGEGTHSVLAAHRGLPQKKLFTDLPDLKEGNIFVLTIFGEKLAYQVDQITVVLPDQIEVLAAQPGEDLVTLLTCTPYMVNSHRLLVRGHRVPYTEAVAATVTSGNQNRLLRQWLIIGGSISLVAGIFSLLFKIIRAWRRRKEEVFISFLLEDATGQPLENRSFSVWDKKGRRHLQRKGQPIVSKTNQKGELEFIGLPKDFYQIKSEEEPKILLKIKPQKKTKADYLVQLGRHSKGKIVRHDNGQTAVIL